MGLHVPNDPFPQHSNRHFLAVELGVAAYSLSRSDITDDCHEVDLKTTKNIYIYRPLAAFVQRL